MMKTNSNQQKFEILRQLNLPLGRYAISASGPLGIRNLRDIADIDLIVAPDLWEALARQYGIINTGNVIKIVFPGGLIEAFREGSFYADPDPDAPTVAERISSAEIIEGLPFVSLEHILYHKRRIAREKDLKDIFLIEEFLKGRP